MDGDGLSGYLASLELEEVIPRALWPHIEIRKYRKGEYLARAGEEVRAFLIIAEGMCRVSSSSEEGKLAVLDYLAPPSVSGDIELLIGCPSLHSVSALVDVTALSIPPELFKTELVETLSFMQMLCRRFAAKLYDTSYKHSSSMLYSLKNRLIAYIADRAPSDGAAFDFGMAEASRYLGSSARHLRRVLAEMEEEGAIGRENGKMRVLNAAFFED